MQLEHYNPELIIDEDAFAWRYVSFSKLWNILHDNEIYFTRLDVFDADPLEGVTSKHRWFLDMHNRKRFDENEVLETLTSLNEFQVNKDELDKWKCGHFASCWYLTEKKQHDESFAMWNLYTDSYGCLIRISFKELVAVIEKSLPVEKEITAAYYGKMHYMNTYQYTQEKRFPIMPSFFKSSGYRHENEVRFIFNQEAMEIKTERAYQLF